MKRLTWFSLGAAITLGLACSSSANAQHSQANGRPEILVHLPNPYAGHPGIFAKGSGRHGGGGGSIQYHGGPVILGGVNAYVIWYGTWTTSSGGATLAKTIVTDFLNSIGGSPYYNINTTYYDGSGTHIRNSVTFAGATSDAYSQGSSNLSDSAIAAVVSRAIQSGALPADSRGIYFVLTSADVTKSGFCTSYCGWHTQQTVNGTDIKYAFVGNPAQCPSACTAQPSVSPNGDVGADGMVSIIAHEMEEANTDPDLNAWYFSTGQENADKCAWTFGTTYTVSNGSKANMSLGGRNYLVQQNWVNSGSGYCALSY